MGWEKWSTDFSNASFVVHCAVGESAGGKSSLKGTAN